VLACPQSYCHQQLPALLGVSRGAPYPSREGTPRYTVIVAQAGQLRCRHAGVFSYYEFRQPMSDRLSDQVWHHMPRRPGQPAWTAGYITS
jgi:Protein of unknown function (DUF3160)